MKIEVNENNEILYSGMITKPVIGQFNGVFGKEVPERIAAANNFGERVNAILYGCNPDSMKEVIEVMYELMRAYGTFKNEVGIYD